MNSPKLMFVVTGGVIFYFFEEDIIKNENDTLVLKKAYNLIHQSFPLVTAQGPTVQIITVSLRFDNISLKYTAIGEILKDSSIYKVIVENETGLKLI